MLAGRRTSFEEQRVRPRIVEVTIKLRPLVKGQNTHVQHLSTLSIALKLVARGLSTTKNHIHSSSDRRPTMLVCATARSLLLRSSAAKRFGIGRRGQLFSLFSTSSAFNTTTNRIRLFTGTDCSLCDVVKETLYEVQKEVSSSVA